MFGSRTWSDLCPQTGEIVVRIRAALTCGTDLKTYRRGYHAKMLTYARPLRT